MSPHSHRERVITALNHKEPDRIPRDLGGSHATLCPSIAERLYNYYGIYDSIEISDSRTRSVKVSEQVLSRFDIDTRWVYVKPASNPESRIKRRESGDLITDEWGMEFILHPGEIHPEYIRFPLSNAVGKSDIDKHSWPDPYDPARKEGLRSEVKRYYDEGFAVGISFGGVWERSWYLRGMDRIMIDLVTDTSFAQTLLWKIMELQISMYETILNEIGEFLSIVCFSSDMGTQSSLLISPELWRKHIRPLDEEFVKLFKQQTDAKIAHHTCGAVRPLIADYIEMGIDVLNPVQTTALGMNPFELKREFGKDICFWGGVDTQKVLPFGSEEDVIKNVYEIVEAFGDNGGYLFATCQNIQDDVPVENIITMFDTLDSCGSY